MSDPAESDARFADAELARFVAGADFGAELTAAAVPALRAATEARATTRAPGPELERVHDVRAGDAPARVYRPFPDAAGPVLLWLHGGGWTIGSPATHDRASRRLARGSGAAVVTLDYRLAPEHPWPAAVDDTVAALRWLADRPAELGFTPTEVAVGGDSAGGLLAALACLRLRDEHPAALPALQVLVYANTDLTGTSESMVEKATGFGLEATTVASFIDLWVPDPIRRDDPRVSPLHALDLAGMPPALVVTAEHDPLRDEGAAYARRLREAGVPVRYRCEPLMVHNFLLLDDVSPAAAAAADRVAADIRELLAGKAGGRTGS